MNNNYFESYNKRTHVIGRISSAIVLVMLVGAPFLIGKVLGAMPDIGAAGKAFLSVGLVWTVSSVVEFLVYTPMLGAGGGYLAFITTSSAQRPARPKTRSCPPCRSPPRRWLR